MTPNGRQMAVVACKLSIVTFPDVRNNEFAKGWILTHWLLGYAAVCSDLKSVIFKFISRKNILSISCEIALRWMLQDLTND